MELRTAHNIQSEAVKYSFWFSDLFFFPRQGVKQTHILPFFLLNTTSNSFISLVLMLCLSFCNLFFQCAISLFGAMLFFLMAILPWCVQWKLMSSPSTYWSSVKSLYSLRKLVLLKSPATCRVGIFWRHKTNVMYMSSFFFFPFVTLETVIKHYLLKVTFLCKQFCTVFSSVSLSEADRIHASIPCQRN